MNSHVFYKNTVYNTEAGSTFLNISRNTRFEIYLTMGEKKKDFIRKYNLEIYLTMGEKKKAFIRKYNLEPSFKGGRGRKFEK